MAHRIRTGDIVAIVHADTRLVRPCFGRVLKMLNANPGVPGGSVGSAFTSRHPLIRLVGMLNDARAAFMGISFGDQLQFFRREQLLQNGGFPDIPLMEDVELSLRLRNMGRTVHMFGDVMVSDRSWRKGRLARAVLVVRLVGVYLWKRTWGKVDTVPMYRRYYG